MKKRMQGYWDKVPGFMKNKYILASVAFLTYLMFFDSMDIPTQYKLQRHLRQLNKQTEYFHKMIDKEQSEYEATLSTVEQMEKFAREEYLMKREDEDLFIIEVQ
ncbi:MAG: septum formation initiator family protein [Bacteroidetes bacterium]|nr:septum formation initiator family protein [Bacteroidota bacterium]